MSMGRYVTLLALLLLASSSFAQQPARADWKLVWSDEFNGTRLDTAKWNVLIREQSKHNELQYYLPDEVYVERGWLRLRSRVRDYGSMHYTSGRLDTSRKFAPTYGRFEIRARLPGWWLVASFSSPCPPRDRLPLMFPGRAAMKPRQR